MNSKYEEFNENIRNQIKNKQANNASKEEIKRLNRQIIKLFQPLSLRKNNVPKYIILDTASLINLFTTTKEKGKLLQNLKEIQYSVWDDYFRMNKKIFKSNNWIYFEPKKERDINLFKKNITIVIIGFNQYTYINKMVNQIKSFTKDIIIIDNKSDYKPLLDFYENDYKYSLLKMDKNFGHKVYEETFITNMLGPIYIITDPDLEFNKNLPKNFIEEMIDVSNKYKAGRVGLALLIDTDDIRPGLSYAGMPIKEWEGRFWKNKIDHPKLELYSAPIDTTFCLLNTQNNIHGLSIRIAGNFVCKHAPWHYNYYLELLDDEYDHYLLNNRK